MIWEMREMLIISIFELVLVLFAMSWDFASGYYKAKLRGEDRNSYGMRRTVSKFILYAGSVCIACSIDAVCYVCKLRCLSLSQRLDPYGKRQTQNSLDMLQNQLLL